MDRWHFVENGDFPNDREQVLVYGKKHFVPDHRGDKNYYMAFELVRYYEKYPDFWGDMHVSEIKAWMRLPKRPRKTK